MKNVVSFLEELKLNNNREWFAKHKDDYEKARVDFENFVSLFILKLAEFDKEISQVSVKECVYRIYRDLRFSQDKTPYKTHFAAYIAFPGGRKSGRGGYYLHIAPDGRSFFGAGVWAPEPPVLNALRYSIFEHYDEFEVIINKDSFRKIYGNSLYEEDKLKRLPVGFPGDFKNPELLKLKHYLVSINLSDKQVLEPDFINHLVEIAAIATPFVQFLNYTIDELDY